MAQYVLLNRLRREAGVKEADSKSDAGPVPVIPSPKPADEEPTHDDYEYYYYYDYGDYEDTGTSEAPGEEGKENAIKEIAQKIGDKMHGNAQRQFFISPFMQLFTNN